MLDIARALTFVAVVLGVVSCSDEPRSDGSCTPPATATYSCEPLPPGTPGCRGTPGPYASSSVPDPDAAFGEGCVISLPLCHPFYPHEVAACSCHADDHGDAGSTLSWQCPG